jgi:hypothetical protein
MESVTAETWPSQVTEGCEVQARADEEAFEEGGPVLHPPEPGLDQGGQLGEVALGPVGQGSFQVRPDQLDRVEFVRIRRELVDGQPVPGPRSAWSSRR